MIYRDQMNISYWFMDSSLVRFRLCPAGVPVPGINAVPGAGAAPAVRFIAMTGYYRRP
jgi:hypothetical protein